ncbi:BrnA antitoxin family protein [Nostoc sp. MS1]|uniref:BrnA antitoxin family protein n=1 Tax=Nostoc sp. MS1 TaxID=2764711 RepID=UPI001CC436FB|nr:BrnA antitoxin family protein [Nostoc sp. MS1]
MNNTSKTSSDRIDASARQAQRGAAAIQANNVSRTDWDRIDAMSDEEIDTSDIPPLSDDFFRKAQLRMPKSPVKITVEVDPETFAWFQAQGDSSEQQIAVALKIYAEAHKAYPKSENKSA